MFLSIQLKDGGKISVQEIKKILVFSDNQLQEEITDLLKFHFRWHCTYSFQGESTVVVRGNDISFLQFS